MADLWLERQKRQQQQNAMKLMASLAPARTEVDAGVVVKADQNIQIMT